ncbi:MAG: DUF2007 domain-containing protein [Calditrichaeota bacterium]|nr:DUF2007 domain-containing protein [Calditrichota bacterium]
MNPRAEELKKIGPLPSLNYAEMISEVLKKENIPHLIKNAGITAALNISGESLAGNMIFILVPKSHYAQALQIIESMIDHI